MQELILFIVLCIYFAVVFCMGYLAGFDRGFQETMQEYETERARLWFDLKTCKIESAILRGKLSSLQRKIKAMERESK